MYDYGILGNLRVYGTVSNPADEPTKLLSKLKLQYNLTENSNLNSDQTLFAHSLLPAQPARV